mmetsp:Transcript_114435/g.296437  ORF Transcript_114435/g.296437 Transcript_114435/m.296437 type:complete len:88 (-) Transcript_114435:184-447(-)
MPDVTRDSARDRSFLGTQLSSTACMVGRQVPSQNPISARQASKAGSERSADAGVSRVKADQSTTLTPSSNFGDTEVPKTPLKTLDTT